jgi:hypothetical protein
MEAPSEVACEGGSELFGRKGSFGRTTETSVATAVTIAEAAKAMEEALMMMSDYGS